VGQHVKTEAGNRKATVIAATGLSCRIHYDDASGPDEWVHDWQIHLDLASDPTKATVPRSARYVCGIGLFSVTREGKTHQIILRDRDNATQGSRVGEYNNIYCTNSTDGQG
jgi:hypothetical protein